MCALAIGRLAQAQPVAGQARPATRPATTRPTLAQPGGEQAIQVSGFVIEYNSKPRPAAAPSESDLANTSIRLGRVDDRYVAAGEDGSPVAAKLSELGQKGVTRFAPSALVSIEDQMRDELLRRRLAGVYVQIDSDQIERRRENRLAMRDLRKTDAPLKVLIWVSKVHGVRTVGAGGGPESVLQKRVVSESPLKQGDLLNRSELDDFVLRLNRQPARRVDVAVAASGTEGEVWLDYLVSEKKPWFVYAQASNTGTKETSPWRERFGFVDYQLSGHDDILSVDYTTASFDGSSQAVNASYEAPFPGMQRLRWRVYGTWNEFTASDVGAFNLTFRGTQAMGGGELIANIYQKKSFFLDAFAGVRFEEVEVTNPSLAAGEQTGLGDFWIPYVGLRIEQARETSVTNGELRLSYGYGDVSRSNLDRLGRLGASNEWWLLSGEFSHSLFLEPLMFPEKFRQGKGTMAHEVFVSARGRYAFERRLIPQEEQPLGGFFTVRGYRESILASDTAFIATMEYRYHVAKGLRPLTASESPYWDTPMGKFNYRPMRPYARPDWDLILRAFFDVGQAVYSKRSSIETNSPLAGAGLGVELQIWNNVVIRMDWGVALQDLDATEQVRRGDSRVHFLAMFLY